jgi:saccharopine dehydrogenase-like NADP-dependent oxidoreductase
MDEDTFRRAVKNACPKTRKDKVLISASIVNKNGHWVRRVCVEHDDNFTAMQKTTGFTAASVTSLIANKSLSSKKAVLGCGDIPMKLFFDNLDKIGGMNTKLMQ